MSELRAYLMGRKTFDPTLDTEALVHGFVVKFYGGVAAKFVLEYMAVMRNATTAYGGTDFSPTSPLYTGADGNATVMAAATAMASAVKALDGADDQASTLYRTRVLRSSLSIVSRSPGKNTRSVHNHSDRVGFGYRRITSSCSAGMSTLPSSRQCSGAHGRSPPATSVGSSASSLQRRAIARWGTRSACRFAPAGGTERGHLGTVVGTSAGISRSTSGSCSPRRRSPSSLLQTGAGRRTTRATTGTPSRSGRSSGPARTRHAC